MPRCGRDRHGDVFAPGVIEEQSEFDGVQERWCSDGFEIKCDSGQTGIATFAQECCARGDPGSRGLGKNSLTGEPVREMP